MMRKISPLASLFLAFLLSSMVLFLLAVGPLPYSAEAQTPPPTLSGEVAEYVGGATSGNLVVTPTGPACTSYSFTVTTTATGPYNGTFTASGTFTLEPMTPDPLTPEINHRVVSWTETFTINQPVSAIPPQPVAHVITGTKQLDPSANSSGINVAQCSASIVNPSPVRTTYQATITGDDGTFNDSGTAQSGIVQLTSNPGAASFFESFTSSQTATTPAPPSCTRIAFVTHRDGNFEIYVMNPDGSGQTNLTQNAASDIYPAWSPDGTKLAFSTDRDGNYEIYLMNADGSNPTRLTNNTTNDYQPDWSPDGTQLAFMSERDGARQIYVMNADGTSQTNLSNNLSKNDELPRWSSDGTKIAFSRSLGADGNGEVYVMDANGANQTNLTNNFAAVDSPMDWSPDNSKILISSNRDDLEYELYAMNADGSGTPTRLTTNTDSELVGGWSPDGTKIAFQTNRDGNMEVYVMNADGSNPTNLTNNGSTDGAPSWGVCASAPDDTDNDGVPDSSDNCPATANPNQEDADGDGVGDACDACPLDAANDADGDGVCGNVDNCPLAANTDQANNDGDALGDACDACPRDANNDADGDGVCGDTDNCPNTANADQADADNDGVGDACSPFQFPQEGFFVVGDLANLSSGATVYFWGSQWAKKNQMSGGPATSSFKGFENGNQTPACGSRWTSRPGNSSNPPPTVPRYMAVIVSSSIQKNGSVITGDVKKIVVVRTDPGYGPSPGHPGTGQVVAILCGPVN